MNSWFSAALRRGLVGLSIGLLAGGQVALGQSSTASVNSSFLYQGQLKYLSGPFNGQADFQFSLWDAPMGGNQIGSTYQVNAVNVIASLFSTPIDFGTSAFNGEARYLQVAIRQSDLLNFIPLLPRQPLYSAPFALQTRGVSIDASNAVALGTTAGAPVATFSSSPLNMVVYAPLSLNNVLDLAPPVGTTIGTVVHQPADANFAPLKMRPAAYGQEVPPQLDWNIYLSQPTDNGGTRQNRVMTFGYNNDPDGFPEVRDDATLVDRWESNWYINGHNHFERHIQYVSVNPGPNYLKPFRPFSIFIDKDDDTITTSFAQDSLSIENADGSAQNFRFAGTSLYCYGSSRVSFPDPGAKTCIYALGSDGNFGDVLGVDAADVIHLGGPHMAGGVSVDNGDLTVSGAATVDNGINVTSGNVAIKGLGGGLSVAEGGSTARMGTARLVNGSVTIFNSAVTANARIFLTSQEDGNGAAGSMRISNRVPGVSFTITSSRNSDTALVAWFIVTPN